MADLRRRAAVVDAEERSVGERAHRRAALPLQDLVDVGVVALEVLEREAPDEALRALDLLQLERDLVEVAEEQLIARDLVRLVAVVDVLTPAQRLLGGHARRGPGRSAPVPPSAPRGRRSTA
jgi:hypothetical protein